LETKIENYTFMKTWSDIYMDEVERRSSVMSDYHAHDYYELSLVLSGDVSILTPFAASSSSKVRALLSPPGVPHYISCVEGTCYRRININFSKEFIYESADTKPISSLLEDGFLIELSDVMAERLSEILREIGRESSRYRRRLLLLYFFSCVGDIAERKSGEFMPEIISELLSYIEKNSSQKLKAEDIARTFGVGRTTLMTNFKKHTGMTLGEYIQKCRMADALRYLTEGMSVSRTAELSGFGECSNMIRVFKRAVGVTPMKYIALMHKF